ncbi:MAG TPA: sulfite exporter TauE/SafE family protein [Polyangiaceae bacterium]|nr:sulfite exporter TauE/SafE family protein [Polyangiaceae bacterium]
MHLLLLMVAAFAAGFINSVAGGGTLLTFPSLLAAHVTPVAANATSTVALVPGSFASFWGYRRSVGGSDRTDTLWFAVPSFFGGAIGALLVVKSGDRVFSRLVPWLLFGAVGLFIAQEPLRRWSTRRSRAPRPTPPPLRQRFAVATVQFFIAVYGGFFGAGIGILMLATMGFMGQSDIHQMNRLKNISAVAINGVAGITFALSGQVRWSLALIMMASAVAGGYLSAGVAQKVGPIWARRAIVVIGLAIGVYTLLRPLATKAEPAVENGGHPGDTAPP